MSDCPFCNLVETFSETIFETDQWYAAWSNGRKHPLLITKRHIQRLEDLRIEELNKLPSILFRLKMLLPTADYKLNVNAGASAGQTVFHLHLHFWPK